MLRLAKETDADVVSSLAKKFFRETQYGKIPLSDVNVRESVQPFLRPSQGDKVCILWDADPYFGIVGAQTMDIPFIERKVAMECMWWVDPEIRGGPAAKELLDAFEHWASLVGADMIQMSCLNNRTGKILDRFYKNRGFTLSELTYTKEIGNASL